MAPKEFDLSVLADVAAGTHHEPHAVLGPHESTDGFTIRVLRPLATAVSIETLDGTFEAEHEHEGIWRASVPGTEAPDYRVHVTYEGEPQTQDDPYRFLPMLGELDLHLIREGLDLLRAVVSLDRDIELRGV